MFRSCLPGLLLVACAGPGPHTFRVTFENTTEPGALVDSQGVAHDIAFAPAILIAHASDFVLFEPGSASSWDGFEAITEDGNNVGLINALVGEEAIRDLTTFARTDADYNELPLLPGQSVTASVVAEPGDHLTWVSMYGQSNDVFVGTPPGGVEAFVDRAPIAGDLSSQIGLYDGGTEVNEEPAVGPNQPGRQASPNTGEDENGVVTEVDGTDASGWTYPAPDQMLSVGVQATEVTEPGS